MMKNLEICNGVLLFIGKIVVKAQEPSVNYGLDASQDKAVNLTG
jgi:hypothetical protein